MNTKAALTLGIFIVLGLSMLGYTLGSSLIKYKELERVVKVKGLAEREVNADTVIWPISYIRASNNSSKLYTALEKDTLKIKSFLQKSGFAETEISLMAPQVTDKVAQNYGDGNKIEFRYSGVVTLTLYTSQVEKAREAMRKIAQLGKNGITFRTESYGNKTEYLFTKLNEIKPAMIQEATKNARISAQTFANDSKSSLGKIKSASQGQFSIRNRDASTPYVKKVRVVSTVIYYLAD
jgi:hypothetical protein